MMAILQFILLVIAIISLWVSICNYITFAQRGKLLNKCIPGDPEFDKNMNIYRKATYYEHLWKLVTFRNPYKLYK
jgi:hypothetical protein